MAVPVICSRIGARSSGAACRKAAKPPWASSIERVNPAIAGRPDLMAGRTSITLAEGMTGMTENVFLNVKNHSKTITAEVEVSEDGGNGTIIAQGGRFGGWSLYVIDGVAQDGGYIMDASAIMQNDTREENLRAMTEFTREYGVYSSGSSGLPSVEPGEASGKGSHAMPSGKPGTLRV